MIARMAIIPITGIVNSAIERIAIMSRRIVYALAAFAALGLAQGACAQQYYAPPAVIAPGPPPPIREEVIPAPPGPPERLVWVGGHYEWSGRGYFWVSGHYVERPEPGLFWEPGRWVARHHHWEWYAGHWRR
jgi:hypothetical protein